MKNIYFLFVLLFLLTAATKAQQINPGKLSQGSFSQPQPFLFTINTLNPSSRGWSLNYSGGFGQNAITPLGYNGVDQQLMVKGYLGANFTLVGSMAVGFSNNSGVQTMQQAEILHDFYGGSRVTGFRISGGLGYRREFNNDNVALGRLGITFDQQKWRMGTNIRFEKAFDIKRDGLDIITTLGVHRRIAYNFYGGIEAIGQDLEGFWQTDEAEGGAKLLVGPSLNFVPLASKFSFSLCGGPIFYATRSTMLINNFAARDLPANNGFALKFNVGFRL
jgi:hypothetical protein